MGDFLANLFDRKFYNIRSTESACVGKMVNHKGSFVARPWPFTDRKYGDTHFAISLFEWNTPNAYSEETFKRRKVRWTGTPLVVLDDVGEVKNGVLIKAPRVEPTFIIETKPGSQQWGYAFNRIVRDGALLGSILKSAAEGGISDPCIGKDLCRIVRLPGSKPRNKEHRAKLVWADWSRRFNPEVLVEKAFQVPLLTETIAAGGSSSGRIITAKEVAPNGDPMLEWLLEQKMVLGDSYSDGWIAIECPFVDEHGKRDNTGTYYRPPVVGDALRAFKCFHGHCKGRKSPAFLKALRRRGAPAVRVVGKRLDMRSAAERLKGNQITPSLRARIMEMLHDQ